MEGDKKYGHTRFVPLCDEFDRLCATRYHSMQLAVGERGMKKACSIAFSNEEVIVLKYPVPTIV